MGSVLSYCKGGKGERSLGNYSRLHSALFFVYDKMQKVLIYGFLLLCHVSSTGSQTPKKRTSSNFKLKLDISLPSFLPSINITLPAPNLPTRAANYARYVPIPQVNPQIQTRPISIWPLPLYAAHFLRARPESSTPMNHHVRQTS
jgi:hypothetical protein